MTEDKVPQGAQSWADGMLALTLAMIDPAGLGGLSLRAQAGPVRERFLQLVPGAVCRMPANIADDALAGGVDLAATLRAGRQVRSLGLLAAAEGGTLLACMAERQPARLAARLGAAMDAGAAFAVIALDEGAEDDERPRPGLLDRLAFHLDLSAVSVRDMQALPDVQALQAARHAMAAVQADDEVMAALCETAAALGIESPRAAILALRVARAAAALAGRPVATLEDAALAARLVLAPRATRLPASAEEQARDEQAQDEQARDERGGEDAPPPSPAEDTQRDAADDAEEMQLNDASEIVLQAARAAVPPGLLARLQAGAARTSPRSQGSTGARQKAAERGRPIGVRAAKPGPGMRLNLVETLRAAAPWQRMRREGAGSTRVQLRGQDFRVTRTEQRARSTTIFLLDASGSAALNRLAEAKGAIELLLADCYQRRDEVAVLAFRGAGAQLLLPPTRSLVRAKRSLAGLPGGGGTPLARGLEAGLRLADLVRRSGCTPSLVLLTDGRANVTRAGTGGRTQAQAEAMQAARLVRGAGCSALLLDTSPRASEAAGLLAQAMGALYIPLPYPSARGMFEVVQAAGARR